MARTVEAGLAGIECLAGIPGSAGATPIQNVGRVRPGGRPRRSPRSSPTTGHAARRSPLTGADCGFSYRHSRFKADPERYVVLRVRFALEDADGLSAPVKYAETARALGVEPGDRVPLAARPRDRPRSCARARAWCSTPRTTTPGRPAPSSPTRSSTTREFAAFHARVAERLGADAVPPAYPAGEGRTKTSAAWLIDKAGFTKGYGTGPARISTKHTLALTNRGGATTEDLLALAREVVAGVHDAFGVTLVNEPVTGRRQPLEAARPGRPAEGPYEGQPVVDPRQQPRPYVLRRRRTAYRLPGQLGQLLVGEAVVLAGELVLRGQPRAEQQRVVGARAPSAPRRRTGVRSGTSSGFS